jgi:hypothetical protein
VSDAYTFWVGAFTTLWVVMFFGFSARQIRKAHEHPEGRTSARSAEQPRDTLLHERDRRG